MSFPFCHPSTILIAGPTGSGKTAFVLKLIKENLFQTNFAQIVWFYNEWQSAYESLSKVVEFRQDCDDAFYETISALHQNLIVLDDQMSKLGDSQLLSKLFTEGSHHRNLSVIYIVQNLFDKGKSHRNVSLNAQYIVLFKNPRETSQIECLSRQVYGRLSRFLTDAYRDATKLPYGYLLLDLRPETEEQLQVRTRVFKRHTCQVYVATKGL